MKQGFLLIEALLAMILLCMLIGFCIQQYGQWSRQYKKIMQHAEALSVLMAIAEERSMKPPNDTMFCVSKKMIIIEKPVGSLLAIPSLMYPALHCTELSVTWMGDDTEHTVSLITGDI